MVMKERRGADAGALGLVDLGEERVEQRYGGRREKGEIGKDGGIENPLWQEKHRGKGLR